MGSLDDGNKSRIISYRDQEKGQIPSRIMVRLSNEQALDSKRVDHGRGHCWICSRSIVARGAPDDRAYYKALESSLGECQERLKARGASIERLLALDVTRFQRSSPLAQTGTEGGWRFSQIRTKKPRRSGAKFRESGVCVQGHACTTTLFPVCGCRPRVKVPQFAEPSARPVARAAFNMAAGL